MKVCVLGLRGMPDVMGGIESHCANLLPRIAEDRECSIDVIVRAPYQPPTREYGGVRLLPLWCVKQKHLEALSHTALGVLYARFKLSPDVLHVHAIGPGLLTPLARALGMRVVVTHHGADYRRGKWNAVARGVLRLGEVASVTFADEVIVVSRSAGEDLRTRYPAHARKIRFIPNGATRTGQQTRDDTVLAELGVAPGEYILSVGRLVPEKGFDDLIAAFRASRGNKTLVIAGAADHQDEYARTLLAKAGERVVFAGFQKRAPLEALYANASLFVLPSYHEGLPMAALEAMAAGAPVLLSGIEAHRDLVLPDPHYFPVGDVAALSAKLEADHGSYRIQQEDFLERYDWSSIASETREVYRSAARC